MSGSQGSPGQLGAALSALGSSISATAAGAAATSATIDPYPPIDLKSGYVATKVGDQVTVTTTHPVTLYQVVPGGTAPENGVVVPSGADFTLYADQVLVQGAISAPGRAITIVAREIGVAGASASISVDGGAGDDVLPATVKAADAGTSQPQARKGDDGAAGGPGKDGDPGTTGGIGSAAGSITIHCNRGLAPLNLTLSAAGGRGGNARNGQDGGTGGTGGQGYDGVRSSETDPTAGGRGGLGGRGGAGAGPSGGGAGGTITFAAVDPASPVPTVADGAVRAGNPGAAGAPGSAGAGGPGGPGGKGWHLPSVWDPEDRADQPPGPDGGHDGGILGDAFVAPSAAFVASDAGDLIAIDGVGTYAVDEVVNGTTVHLIGPVTAGVAFSKAWRLVTISPWGWPAEGDAGAPPDWPFSRGTRGTADGTTTFSVLGGDFQADHAGCLLVIVGRGAFVIESVTDANTVVLSRLVAAGTTLEWIRLDAAPAAPSAAAGTTSIKAGTPVADFTGLVDDGYLYMQADRARFVFLSADPAQNPDAFKDTWDRIEWVMSIIESRTSANGPTDALVPLWSDLDGMRTSLNAGLDYFGHSEMWAPLLRYEFYANQLDDAIDGLAQAETESATNRATALRLLQQQAKLTDLASLAEASSDRLAQTIKDANGALIILDATITEQDAEATAARTTLNAAIRSWSQATNEALSNPFGGLTAGAVFDAISQLAFFPEAKAGEEAATMFKRLALVGGQAGKLGSQLGGEPTVTGDDGQTVPIRWEVSQLRSIGETAADLKTGFGTAADGTLELDDPNAQMLITTQQSLDQLCDEFYTSGGAEAKAAKAAMDAYVTAITTRNGTILRYNASLVTLRCAQQRQKDATALANRAQDTLATTSTIGLAEHLVDRAVDRAREACIEVLYNMGRAYQMFALDTDDAFYGALKLGQAWEFSSSTASDVRTNLTTTWSNAIAARYTAHGEPSFTTVEDPKRTGESWDLTPAEYPKLFAGLRTHGTATVQLPPSLHLAPTGPFAHQANVRLRIVRCWLHGVTSSTHLVAVELIHRGDDQFVRGSDNAIVAIQHDPVSIDCWYRAASDADLGRWQSVETTAPAAPGVPQPVDGIVVDSTGQYVAIGPFATWEIRLLDIVDRVGGGKLTPAATVPKPGSPPRIDASKLSRITFEFFVFFDDFA